MTKSLGERLTNLRKAHKLTQNQLADKLGVTFQAVSKWETGAAYPDIEILPVLSELFSVSIDYILNPDNISQKNLYNKKYTQAEYYWGVNPNPRCFEVMKALPPARGIKLLDIGCGEGKDAVFFARNGYEVTAFDLSPQGIAKTCKLAEKAGVIITAFVANMNEYRLHDCYDIIYSSGTLNYIPESLRNEIFENYIEHTNIGGIHSMSAFVKKPFIAQPPDHEDYSYYYKSGELFTYYSDMHIISCNETIFECMSSGTLHKHCVNTILAKKV